MTGPAESPVGQTEFVTDEAFQQLYDAHASAILSFLMRHTYGDWHRCEDILQETLVRAWRHPEVRASNGDWSRPWLLTVARRILIDQTRAARSRPTELGDDRLSERQSVDDGVDQLIDKAEVREAIAALPDRYRDVLIEIYYRSSSGAEAAEALGIPVGTVKSRAFYALRALREALADRGYLPPTRRQDSA